MAESRSVDMGQLSKESSRLWARSITIHNALSDISYPATKDKLVKHAQVQGVDDDVLSALQALPDKTYEGPSDVDKEISKTTDKSS